MKLIAEQIKYLRERRKVLEGKREEYRRYCQTRESGGLDSIGGPHFLDYQAELDISSAHRELRDIEQILAKGEFITERNFDAIDVGTKFTIDFGDGEDDDETILVERNETTSVGPIFVSLESDLGKAVLGKKVGDDVVYTVSATGRKISAKIKSIETMKERYAHFIKEEAFTDRISTPVSEELRRLKEEDREEYDNRHAITPSQQRILEEELSKISNRSTDPKDVSKRGHINKLLRESKIAALPTGEEVKVGSIVEFMIQDGESEPITYKVEMINRAVSTEIDTEYVERITPLGQAIYGKKTGETFTVRRSHKPGLKGVIVSVENYDEKERVR